MTNSVIKDVLMASGISLEAATTTFCEAMDWVVDKSSSNWFKNYVYEPEVTDKKILFTQVSTSKWDVIFKAFNVAEATQDQILAMSKNMKGAMKASDHVLEKAELEAIYNDAYEHRVELAEKEAQLKAEKAARDAEKKAQKEAAKIVSGGASLDALKAELGITEDTPVEEPLI